MNDVAGWPRIILSLTARDFFGRDTICGYGIMHVPTQPGHHTRYVQIFKPKTSSFFIELIGYIKGKPVELHNQIDLLDKSVGREVARTESSGVVKLTF
mmetsp:Transcript_16640/g.28355  ORF Transcript_16640/g.28355 Transcript_16640/m.28355 type:complete len:98 (+) Transcript_16640:328-621(+)